MKPINHQIRGKLARLHQFAEHSASFLILLLAGLYLIFLCLQLSDILRDLLSGDNRARGVVMLGIPFTVLAYLQWHWRRSFYPALRAEAKRHSSRVERR